MPSIAVEEAIRMGLSASKVACSRYFGDTRPARYTRGRRHRFPARGTRGTRIYCERRPSGSRTRSGRLTSRTSGSRAAMSISSPSSTSTRGRCCRGGCRTPWTPSSAWRHSRKRSPLWGVPAIFNTDQGSQFTSDAFVDLLESHGIRVSMDGKNRALDNIFVERLWRTLKYEDSYLKD